MSNWQSIETAPKDGTWILTAKDGYIEILRRVGEEWWDIDGRKSRPTHWQPLPEPPGVATDSQ